MRQLNKSLSFAANFAKLAALLKMPPNELASLTQAAILSAKAWENHNNKQNPRALKTSQRYANIVESIAKDYNLKVEWSGLYPVLIDLPGREYHLVYPT